MKDKIAKFINVLKKYDFLTVLKKSFSYVKANYFSYGKFNKKEAITYLDKIFKNKKYDRIIVWRSSFGWNVPLFQRSQHIATNLALKNCLVFYEVTTMTDKVTTINKIKNNLYLVNFKNKKFAKLLNKYLIKDTKPKYLQFYSTDYTLSVKDVQKYQNNGYKVIYEYIDDLNPAIAGVKELPKNCKEKFELAMSDKSIFVVVTASLLEDDVICKRGNSHLCYACNGVDYDFYQQIDKKYHFEKNFLDIINDKLPTIGYYGAIASWFDYNLVKKLAETGRYNIVLFGIIYDEHYRKSGLDKLEHIYFMGPKDYKVLKNYASKLDALMIPFKINDITKATSPLKIFEYMALHKPIITTDMNECRKYDSVLTSKTHQEFISNVDKAIKFDKKTDKDYFALLSKEAKANTWDKKTDIIISMLKKSEVEEVERINSRV